MVARERRSKRRSASSGTPPDAPEFDRVVFFVDRSLGSKFVPEALRATGARVEIHEKHFSDEAEDADWLAEVGRRGWVVLTKDDRIRYRPHEVAAIERANVRAYVHHGTHEGRGNGSAVRQACRETGSHLHQHAGALCLHRQPNGQIAADTLN